MTTTLTPTSNEIPPDIGEEAPDDGKVQTSTGAVVDELTEQTLLQQTVLDKACVEEGQYWMGLVDGTVITFTKAHLYEYHGIKLNDDPTGVAYLVGMMIHLDTAQSVGRITPVQSVPGFPFKDGIDVQVSNIVWVAEQEHQ